jgi:hypothetical protein
MVYNYFSRGPPQKIIFRGRVHNTLFSSQLTNGHNKLVRYIKLGWRGLTETTSPAYRAHSLVLHFMVGLWPNADILD